MRSSQLMNLHMLVLAALVWVSLVSTAMAFSRAEYAKALDKSILFFDLQRSGKLPSWQRLRWRGNSGLRDGSYRNVDLSGGYYDAGDNVKFNLPMAFTVAILAWDVVEFRDALRESKQLGNTLNAIRWGTDYLLKCSSDPNELWVQVGDPNSDHRCWQRPEEMRFPRAAYKVDANRPGSDVAGETAAALAAASIAFRGVDYTYSSRLLARARRVRCGTTSPLIRNGNALGGSRVTVNTFSWDNKFAGAQVLLAQVAHSSEHCSYTHAAQRSGGMLYYMPNSNMQYVTSASFLLTTYARYLTAARKTVNCGGRDVTPAQLFSVARRQVDYILGRNPTGFSYMIGFGRNPTQVHHRAASLPSVRAHPQKIPCWKGFAWFNSRNPNANLATGAVLGGPGQNDNFFDARYNFAQTEPTTYINAPIVGVLSELAAGHQYY